MSFETTPAGCTKHNKMDYLDDSWDFEAFVDQLLREYDETYMPVPNIEYQPHVLISKVRKHYMDYLIKLLTLNYKTEQKLIEKNINLPSAIWRCAKTIETKAAQMCMVVQLYRKHIVSAIKEIKTDTKRCQLNKNLYECLHRLPENEKKSQTTLKRPQCHCSLKRRHRNMSPRSPYNTAQIDKYKDNTLQIKKRQVCTQAFTINGEVSNEEMPQNDSLTNINQQEILQLTPESSKHMSLESQVSDEIMMQLEKLFEENPDDVDLYDSVLCDTFNSAGNDISKIKKKDNMGSSKTPIPIQSQDSLIPNHDAEIKSLREKIVSLEMIFTNENNRTQDKVEPQEVQKSSPSKWLCEEHFWKTRYFKLLAKIGDTDSKKLTKIKELIQELFGEDSDNEGKVPSPLDDTPEYSISCMERIAPWINKLLTPYYKNGHIRGKDVFKSFSKHLIKLIIQCSHHPSEYEVKNFVKDFLDNHKIITCEEDYKKFSIGNSQKF